MKGGVEWRGQMIVTPTWWQELLEILGVSNVQELAQEDKGLFQAASTDE